MGGFNRGAGGMGGGFENGMGSMAEMSAMGAMGNMGMGGMGAMAGYGMGKHLLFPHCLCDMTFNPLHPFHFFICPPPRLAS